MRSIALFLSIIVCQSCFHFTDFKKTRLSLPGHSMKTVVPKKFNRSQVETDSLGNLLNYYYYPDGSVLYFASLKDTTTQLQPIVYVNNIPKELYHTRFFKGLDSTGHFWRETRFGSFRAGYKNVNGENETNFDSSINYFSLRMKR
ncbi:MAG: hypothetical protein ACXVBZ_02680 [Flavisolibacter sp.]